MIKLGKASLRGEIIRPVCKCKLLRNFLPSPTLSCTILLANLSRERECGKSKRECERRRKTENYLYMCVRIWSYVWHVWREDGEIEAGKKDKKAIGQVVQHGPTFDSEIQERKSYRREIEKQAKRAQPSRMADITNVIIHPTLRPPRVWGMRSVGQWILTKSCLTENWVILVCLRFHTLYYFSYIHIYTASYYIYYLIARNMLAVSPCSFRIIYHLTVFR